MTTKNFLIVVLLAATAAHAELAPPPVAAPRQVGDAAMVIHSNGQQLEVLPGSRAVRKNTGRHQLVAASHSDTITKDQLGVAYSYATGDNVLLTGEISFKLKAGANIAQLGSLARGAKIFAPPDVYLVKASTPSEIVRLTRQLQASSAVEWAETYSVRQAP